jgi:hypothetical protein
VQEFSGEKIESTIFGGNSCSYLDGRGDHKYFHGSGWRKKLFQFYASFFRHGGIRAQQRIFLNVLRESVAKFA